MPLSIPVTPPHPPPKHIHPSPLLQNYDNEHFVKDSISVSVS